MNVLNGEPFIRYQLDSIYPYSDEIIIVEGAYEKFRHASTPEGRSTDKTLDVIRAYPDPERKIKLIARDGFYEDRLGMCNVLLEHATGDIVWQVDTDEFYAPGTHAYVRKLFESDAELDRVSFHFYDFFASPEYFIRGYETAGLADVNRVHRFRAGDRWHSQRPPLLATDDGRLKPVRKHVGGAELQREGHAMLHATLFFEKQILEKYKYYASMWGSISKPSDWMLDVWRELSNKFNVACMESCVTYLCRTPSLDFPEPLLRMVKDIKSGSEGRFMLRRTDDIETFLGSDVYPVYAGIAEDLNRYVSAKKGSFCGLWFRIQRNLDAKTRHFASFLLLKTALRNVRKSLLSPFRPL